MSAGCFLDGWAPIRELRISVISPILTPLLPKARGSGNRRAPYTAHVTKGRLGSLVPLGSSISEKSSFGQHKGVNIQKITKKKGGPFVLLAVP